MIVLQVVVFAAGLMVVVATILSAIRTFVLPRSVPSPLNNVVFRGVRKLCFEWRVRRAQTYEQRDEIMAMYAPIALLTLPPVWLTLVCLGYAAMFWTTGEGSFQQAFVLSGSSLLTLGFVATHSTVATLLAVTEAAIGLILVALLIAYLPTIYSAFTKREAVVTLLEVRAGSPPSALELIKRFHRIHGLNRLHDTWLTWEPWFAEVQETHTSLAALVFFRSPRPEQSWVTAAGAVLDAAALVNSSVEVEHDIQADLCLRAGYLCLRAIADFFRFPYDKNPKADDPICISRQEFDEALDELAAAGVPLKADRAQAWRSFSGWRVNYDAVLLELCELTMAPYAQWSSDRSSRMAHRRQMHKAKARVGAAEPELG